LNLPSTDKFVDPHFSMFWRQDIPRRIERDKAGRTTELTIIAGRWQNTRAKAPPPKSWAARTESDVAIWTLKLAAGAQISLPPARPGTLRTLYFFSGESLRVGSQLVRGQHAIELRGDARAFLVNGPVPSQVLLLQGRPIAEPVVQRGPFVMNSSREIEQAFADYRRTGFGGWPWANNGPVHVDAGGRFARHADGRIERAT
jgi:redox-sensitive bicupin YhaK (pirin superfamily)